ncbi:hypothetical protein [Pseudogemmobacter bohemicus]|uniref:hypothetical protein n=1 Tax=Pseudogemmobacter bohemicus TaxID=2250708 RepID=UPI0013003550|nr:hypothetical protein [Pseudogemmobacter bohemicus]
MAVVTMIVGGMLGFLSGLVALILGSGAIAALSLWFSVAAGAVLLAGLFALLPRRNLATADV